MDKIIRPVFTLELNYKIVPGLTTIGKYDGTHPCLTAATTADKILIHSPHRKSAIVTGRVVWSESNREIATLNINQSITALAAGPLIPQDDKDILIVGTPTHILAYHVHDNRDIFYKECPDGVRALTVGLFHDSKSPMVLSGGNSTVHGYDAVGNELFWLAIGDAVTSLILHDYNKDQTNELIVSSEDYNIRVYKGDRLLAEQTETEVVTGLAALPDNRFAYSVSNGTVGVYEQDIRLWRVKSKNFAISLFSYDLLGQGHSQLITGWSNGKVDCRSIKTGEVLFKDTLGHGCAGIVEGDYRSIGKADLICTSSEGEVRGYTTTKSLSTTPSSGLEQDTVRDLLAQKQALLLELKHYENNSKVNEEFDRREDNLESNGVIPANTRLQIAISANDNPKTKNHVEIFILTNNNTVIKAVIVFAEGIFKGETHVVHPQQSKLSTELSVQLYPPKDNPVDIHIKALVGYSGSNQFHVFEITRQLPRFSMYALCETKGAQCDSFVELRISERLQRMCMWINQNFLLAHDIEFETGPELKICLKCLRDDSYLSLLFDISGRVVIKTENISLAADLVQSLANFNNLESLETKVNLPKEEEKIRIYMEKLTQIQEARMRLGTDVADRLGQIRGLIVRAEDSRVNCLSEMPKYYNELKALNSELTNGYNIRLANFNEGQETMKNINFILQKATRLRAGAKSSKMIGYCRTAIKNNNIDGLIKIIRTGEL
ncbi:PREDICTED: Bardet-Biedl syndrome 2 protein-like [Nicrophorus vespilloides]|uniref:Bardet-Biedl syndrome 2 protein homolog n=1 Tax=Nicrophorus vespilloides TaxID=110193 RepID=A0ABM1M0R4_NICVS|nr:PREDICTED: Bardet-Biedl syndrome 2 protein-like [Nicrophorus vespilloides]